MGSIVLSTGLAVPAEAASPSRAAAASSVVAPSKVQTSLQRGQRSSLRGFDCQGFSCGYKFSEGQTKTLYKAAVAGGAVAATAACPETAGLTCPVAAVFIATLVGSANPTDGKCLYATPIPGSSKLEDC